MEQPCIDPLPVTHLDTHHKVLTALQLPVVVVVEERQLQILVACERVGQPRINDVRLRLSRPKALEAHGVAAKRDVVRPARRQRPQVVRFAAEDPGAGFLRAINLHIGMQTRNDASRARHDVLEVEPIRGRSVLLPALVVLQPDPLRELVRIEVGNADPDGIAGSHEIAQHEQTGIAGHGIDIAVDVHTGRAACVDQRWRIRSLPSQPIAVPGAGREQTAVRSAHQTPAALQA